MKTKIISVLFCILISTSLGHDHHRAKTFTHQNRKSHHHLSHFHERDGQPGQEQCKWVCEGDSDQPPGDIQILANATAELIGIVNVTAEVALVLDLKANLVGLFNGTSGIVIVVDIATGSGIYLTLNDCDNAWLSSQQSFEEFFRSLSSLQVYLDLKTGIRFDASSITNLILENIASILSALAERIALDLSGQLKQSLKILLEYSSRFSAILNGSLKGFLELIGKAAITIRGNLVWFLNVLEGLNLLLTDVRGGLAGLVKAGVELDIAFLLAAHDGVELLVNFLLAVVVRVDLAIFSGILNSLEGLFTVIVYLGGGVSSGVSGALEVILGIVSFINGNLNIDILIKLLIEFAASGSTDIDLSVAWDALGSVVSIQESSYTSVNITGFVSIVEQLRNGSLVVKDVKVSGIIDVLIEYSSSRIELIVRVLLQLSQVIKAEEAIAELVLDLILELNTTRGVTVIEQLIPGLSIKISASGGIDLKALINATDLPGITKQIVSGDIDGLLRSLPVIKDIYGALSQAVTVASNGSLSVKTIITGSGARSIVTRIIGWIAGRLQISVEGHLPHLGPGPVVHTSRSTISLG